MAVITHQLYVITYIQLEAPPPCMNYGNKSITSQRWGHGDKKKLSNTAVQIPNTFT